MFVNPDPCTLTPLLGRHVHGVILEVNVHSFGRETKKNREVLQPDGHHPIKWSGG